MSKSQHYATLHDAVLRYTSAAQGAEMEGYLRNIMHAESGGNRKAKNGRSSATGLFQFIRSTANAYGLTGDKIYDPHAQCDAVVRFALDNRKVLVKALHREPTSGEYYLAHFSGPDTAARLIKAEDETPISSILDPGAMTANALTRFRGKSFGQFNVGDLKAWANTKMHVNMDERMDYQQRHDLGKTTEEEDKHEIAERKRILEEFGMSKEIADKIPLTNILGDLFFAILKMFMNDAATQNERAAPTPQAEPIVPTTPVLARAAWGKSQPQLG